jgi:hypothetical protein
MFAGIGGWGQAIKALANQDHPIFSVELDPTVATALSLSTKRVVLSVEQLLDEPHCEDAVLVADVLDSRWWVTTLSAPFTDLGWSTPCQPWSQAGKGQGLNHPFGRLLVHSIGIMFLFGIPVAAMENVPGLVEHPHWKWIHSLLRELPTPCEVTQSDLANIGYMSRSRCFLLFGADRNEKCVKDFQSQSRPDWIQANCRITDQIALEQTTIPEQVREKLSKRNLLPDQIRREALMRGVQDGRAVLELRIAPAGTLPTLVASYRKQAQLSRLRSPP